METIAASGWGFFSLNFTIEFDNSNAGALSNTEYPFNAIDPRSSLAWSGSTWLGPIYESNNSVIMLN